MLRHQKKTRTSRRPSRMVHPCTNWTRPWPRPCPRRLGHYHAKAQNYYTSRSRGSSHRQKNRAIGAFFRILLAWPPLKATIDTITSSMATRATSPVGVLLTTAMCFKTPNLCSVRNEWAIERPCPQMTKCDVPPPWFVLSCLIWMAC